jgi:hypothetical protein
MSATSASLTSIPATLARSTSSRARLSEALSASIRSRIEAAATKASSPSLWQ